MVAEDDELPHGHLAPGGAVIVFKHIQDGLPQQFQVLLRKAGDFAGQVGRYMSFRPVEAVGHNVLAAHLVPPSSRRRPRW